MNTVKLLAAACVAAAVAAPAAANTNWVGTANYGVETVGPFNTLDFSSAGVFLLEPSSANQATGYYQSFVSQHLLDGLVVQNPLLSAGNYEITVVAALNSTRTPNAQGETFTIDSGRLELWLDTTPDRSFNSDSGFANGTKILEAQVLNGAGSVVNFFGMQFGGGSLQFGVTGYDSAVFNPATIGSGDSIFTLRLNAPTDQAFLGPISSVQGHAVSAQNLKFAADGNLMLTAVPEPREYAMLLAGLMLVGTVAARRSR